MRSQKRRTPGQPEIVFSDMDRPQKPLFWEKKGFIAACIFSAIWLAFIWDYIAASGWWTTRYDLSPAEFVGSFCGLFLPIVIVLLVSAYFDRSEQLAYEAQTLQSYLNELVYPTEEGAVYTKVLTEALRTQIREFREVFGEVEAQTESVRSDLKEWVADLSKIIKHVDTKTTASVQEIADHIHGLVTVTDQINEQAVETSVTFAEQSRTLQMATKETASILSNLSNTLQMHTSDIQNITHSIENANERTEAALDRAGGVVDQIQGHSQAIELAVDHYETTVQEQNMRLFNNFEKVVSVFKEHGSIIEQEAEEIAGKVVAIEEAFIGNAQTLVTVADTAVERLSEANDVFAQSADRVHDTIGIVYEDMRGISKTIETQAKKIEKVMPVEKVKNKTNTDLLKDATTVLNKLQSFSVDMAHIFSPKAEEALWQKYYGGDKAVFMRHIKKMISESQNKKIVDLYKKNADFKDAVTRYMSDFEEMTKQAQDNDENKLLMSVLVGSDVGRLYMVLANVLKKGA